MPSSRSCPCFVFGYVAGRSRPSKELKAPLIERQLGRIGRFLLKTGWTPGECFVAVTTYRRRAFVDHPTFHKAVADARGNGVPLIVGDLGDLLSRVPAEQFSKSVNRILALDIDLLDASTGKLSREMDKRAWRTIRDAAFVRAQARQAIATGQKSGKKPTRDVTLGQAKGAEANKLRARRLAESIRPIVAEMKAELPHDQDLSPSAVMHHLNALGIKGPNAGTWSRVSVSRYLRILSEPDAQG